MRKETEEYLRMWLNTYWLTDPKKVSRFADMVRELFEDWERLKHMEDKRGLDQEPPLTSEGVYE